MPSDTKRVVKDPVNRCYIPALSMHVPGQSIPWSLSHLVSTRQHNLRLQTVSDEQPLLSIHPIHHHLNY
jgi:hypothetical protein